MIRYTPLKAEVALKAPSYIAFLHNKPTLLTLRPFKMYLPSKNYDGSKWQMQHFTAH